MKPNAFVFVFPEPFCPDLYTVTLSHTARSLFRLVLYQIGAIAIVTTAVGAAAQAAVDFEPGLSYELSGEGPKDIIVGHFNKAIDAHVDLAIPSFVGDGDVTVLLGNGAGSFADDQPFSVPFNARGIAQGDFDGDGDWDLAVVGPQGASQDPKLRVYLGDGAGLFVEHAALDASGTPTAVVSGDFDEDGIIDLAVTDSNRGGVSTFRGLGAGSFSPRVQIAATAGLGPGDILAADFDRDGHVDLAIPQTVLLGAGDGTFSKPGNRGGHAAGDLNLDGNLDLVVVSGAQLIVWFGNGDGTFEVGSVQSVTGASLIVARVTDFNRDSLPDVAVVDETNDTVEILLGLGGGSLGTPQSFPTGEEPGALETGDWNGDGYPDLAVPYRVDPGPKIGAFVWVAQQQVPPAPGAPPQGYLQLGAPTYSVDEAIGTITIHVTRTGGTSGQVTVEYHATDGTASEAADFELASGTLVFPDGVASRSFVLAIVDDDIFEGTELAELSLASAAGGAALGAIDTAQITILDNDLACGNGIVDPPEVCDDGNTVGGDGCSATCNSTEICGNDVLDPGEVCDDGNTFGGDGCSATCQYEICGNGFLDPSEVCDDGNTFGGDGCSATCDSTEVCGNGLLDPGEVCDDGNTFGGDGCSATWQYEICGNGLLDPSEICDDGNTVGGDGCSATCDSTEICGNGLLDPSEVCDDGNTISGDGCSATCDSTEVCGNTVLDPGEVCDDGNTIGGDGCSADCQSSDCIDNDSDGFGQLGAFSCPAGTEIDCNDDDDTIYPGNVEACNGLDDDCDESIDEGLSTDADGDGFYTTDSCMEPATDCHDVDGSVHPGVPELCDGEDNDCNGVTDDGDICNPGGELDVVTITMSKGLYREDGLISAFRPYVVEICVEGVIATASILTPNGLPELAIPMDVSESCLVESFDDASSLDEAFPNGDYRFTFDGGVDSITVAFEAVQPAAFADVIDPADGANVPSSRDLVIRWTLQPPGCAPCGDGIRVKVCNVDTDTELFSSAPLPISTDQWTVPASALQPGDELDIHVETFNGATIDSSTDGSDLLTITVTSDETNILKIPEPVSGLLQLVALLSVAFLSKTRHRN
jgi:cysteine-rich repeat protein